jgi:hypothetical protein
MAVSGLTETGPPTPGRRLGPPRTAIVVDCLLLALGTSAVTVSVLGGSSTARLTLDLAAACLVPGAAMLTLLGVDDLLSALGLAFALSFCIEGAGALAMIWSGVWHPVAFSLALVALAAAALGIDLRRALRELARGRP